MRYRSTRSSDTFVTVKEAVFQGLAPDGGLFIPETLPVLSAEELQSYRHSPIEEIGAVILSYYIEDIRQEDLQRIIKQSLSFPFPLRKVGEKTVLELFHGPTMAFKDVAAQILPRLMEHYLDETRQETLILTATSGDTGGAVAHGFSNKEHIRVVILFPKDKVSKLQYNQLTHVGKNIFPIEVDGTFDDCQDFVKQAFIDDDFKKHNLTSANSINIGRLLPQIIYYAYAWSRYDGRNVTFVVPSGNMGNVTAGFYAKMMGIPIEKLVIACNTNDPVVRYFESGRYSKQSAHQTLSTAMDIGHPSNFERVLAHLHHDHQQFTDIFSAVRTTDDETIDTISRVYKDQEYILDPHTAVAWNAAEKLSLKSPVIISTAAPLKFASEIKDKTNITVPTNSMINFEGTPIVHPESNSYAKMKRLVQTFINQ